jgi:hypothetical protein
MAQVIALIIESRDEQTELLR